MVESFQCDTGACANLPAGPYLRTSDPDGPQDDFCLLLNEFEVSGPPSIEDDDKEGDKTDDLSDTEDAVPEMPSFPPDQNTKGEIGQAEIHVGLASLKPGAIVALDSGSSLASASSAAVVPTMSGTKKSDRATEGSGKRRGRCSKRRKNAEERAAQIRARNRRAQQAFRKRQKVLSAEKNDSLAKLEDEVLNLKDENIKLEQRIDELQTELENERRCRAEAAAQHSLPLLSHHIGQHYDHFFEHEHPDVVLPSNFLL